jgi:sarcosine oxidase subunit gamma
MADPTPLRRSALGPETTRLPGVTIAPAPLAARAVLRLAPEIAATKTDVAGFDLSGTINTVRGTADRFAARLGPDEWLLVAPEAEEATLVAAIDASLADVFHSAVDISHRNVGLVLEGESIPEIVNAASPLDLADHVFPPGSASRTVFAKAEIVLVRPAGGAWRIETTRSFGPYVLGVLNEAAR